MIRNISHIFAAAAILCGLALTNIARADLITFDDLPDPGTGASFALPSPYHNLDWSNFGYTNGGTFLPPPTGGISLSSLSVVAFNSGGTQADIYTPNSAFSIETLSVNAGWNDGLNLLIDGFNGSSLLDAESVTLQTIVPTYVTLDWSGLTDLRLISSGGVPNPTLSGSGTQFVVNYISVDTGGVGINGLVPEPGLLSLLSGLSVAGSLLAGRRWARPRR